MKKVSGLFLSLFCIAFLLSSITISHAKSETMVGKLVYYEYSVYPYVLELNNGNTIALEVDLDKKFRNQSMDKLLGKRVQVSGPARPHGLKIIDIRPGKGNIKALR